MRRDKWSPSRRWSSARHSSDSLVHGGGAQRSILPAQATPSTIGLASLPCEFQSWFCATSTLTKTRQCMEASCLLNYVTCLENETVCGTGLAGMGRFAPPIEQFRRLPLCSRRCNLGGSRSSALTWCRPARISATFQGGPDEQRFALRFGVSPSRTTDGV